MTMRRSTLLATRFATGLLMLPLAACQGGEPAEPAFAELAAGLAARDLSGVPLDDPDAGEQLAAIWATVPEDQPIEVDATGVTTEDDSASATLDWTWQLEDAEWAYETPVEATRVDDAWQVRWTPGLLAPDLVEGEVLALTRLPAARGEVLGASDATIVGARPVVRLGLTRPRPRRTGGGPRPARSPATSASASRTTWLGSRPPARRRWSRHWCCAPRRPPPR